MGLLDLLARVRPVDRIQELAVEVATASTDAVRDLVEGRAVHMTPPEARGYIRARSATVVAQQLQLAVASQPALSPRVIQDVMGRARAEVTRQVMKQVRENRGRRAFRAAA